MPVVVDYIVVRCVTFGGTLICWIRFGCSYPDYDVYGTVTFDYGWLFVTFGRYVCSHHVRPFVTFTLRLRAAGYVGQRYDAVCYSRYIAPFYAPLFTLRQLRFLPHTLLNTRIVTVVGGYPLQLLIYRTLLLIPVVRWLLTTTVTVTFILFGPFDPFVDYAQLDRLRFTLR